MDVEAVKQLIEQRPNLSTHFISMPDADVCKATATADKRNRQNFGFLSGGVSLVLSENVAGVGQLALCPDRIRVGISVIGNHVKTMTESDTVTATECLASKGRKLHVWDVDITDSPDELISIVHVTNNIITPQNQTDE